MVKKNEQSDRITKVCDRCNTTLTRDWHFRDYIPINTDGWHTTNGKLICPQCYSHGLVLFEKFMRKEI